MIRSLFFAQTGKLSLELSQDQWASALLEPEGLLWVDFQGNPPDKDEMILRQVFHFHPLAIDDALQESHVPKVDDWSDYLYIVLHAVSFDLNQTPQLDTQELDIFLGKNYLITHHDELIELVGSGLDIDPAR